MPWAPAEAAVIACMVAALFNLIKDDDNVDAQLTMETARDLEWVELHKKFLRQNRQAPNRPHPDAEPFDNLSYVIAKLPPLAKRRAVAQAEEIRALAEDVRRAEEDEEGRRAEETAGLRRSRRPPRR